MNIRGPPSVQRTIGHKVKAPIFSRLKALVWATSKALGLSRSKGESSSKRIFTESIPNLMFMHAYL